MVQNLNTGDIKKLKSYIRQSYGYGLAIFLLFCYLFMLSLQDKINMEPSVIAFLGVLAPVLLIWLLAGTEIRDLKSGKKEVVEKMLEVHDDERKIKVSKVGALISAWGFSKKKKKKHYLLHINDATFEVTEEQVLQAEKRGRIKVHYSFYGRKVLKVEV